MISGSFYDPDYYAGTQKLTDESTTATTSSHINYTWKKKLKEKKRKRISLCICVTKDGENNTEEALGSSLFYDETDGVKKWEGPKGSSILCVVYLPLNKKKKQPQHKRWQMTSHLNFRKSDFGKKKRKKKIEKIFFLK